MSRHVIKITVVYSDGSEQVFTPDSPIHTADDSGGETPPPPPKHPEG